MCSQDGRGASQCTCGNVVRDWPTGEEKVHQPPPPTHQQQSLTAMMRWQAETMRDQPYHNIQAFKPMDGKEESSKSSRQLNTNPSVAYLDFSKEK
ncbi:hypothetical protein G7Y89_g2714 [Cudoniella acicularis]|uniref:Uncharacterized protein n=1 Tax=Cudoniella acicularis TaxID=354080 RepID=A0A8H4W939_9HELO|nr:hypothetical protein G7Y89_g2714 [Cudoniella acicularis]